MLQFSQFVWTPCYSVWDVFINFLPIDATDRSKISSDQKSFFILSLYPLSFFANTPFQCFKRWDFDDDLELFKITNIKPWLWNLKIGIEKDISKN